MYICSLHKLSLSRLKLLSKHVVQAWSKFLGIYNDWIKTSVRGSVRSLLMISLNLEKKTFSGPNFPPMTILPLSLYYKDIIKDNVNVQEYLAYIKSMQKVHWITIPISANGENERRENSRSANLRLEKICQHYLRFPQETNTWSQRRFDIIFRACAVKHVLQLPVYATGLFIFI